jgi:hypothetical protein
MCYNKEVSFVLALFGICCAIKEFRKNIDINTLKGLFIICLVIMQVNEFFLHVYNKPTTWMHQISAFMIPITLLLQVIIILISIVVIPVLNKEIQITGIVLSSLYIVIHLYFIFAILIPILRKKGFDSTLICSEGCRLRWDSIEKTFDKYFWLALFSATIYIICIFMITYGIFGWEMMTVLISLLGFAFLWSFTGNQKQYNRVGSMWCLLAVIVFSAVIIGN